MLRMSFTRWFSDLHGLQQRQVVCSEICGTIEPQCPGNDEAMATRLGVCIVDDHTVTGNLHFWILVHIPASQ